MDANGNKKDKDDCNNGKHVKDYGLRNHVQEREMTLLREKLRRISRHGTTAYDGMRDGSKLEQGMKVTAVTPIAAAATTEIPTTSRISQCGVAVLVEAQGGGAKEVLPLESMFQVVFIRVFLHFLFA